METIIKVTMTIVVISCIYISIDTLQRINSGIITEVVSND